MSEKNLTMAESYTLPSLGKVYNVEMNPEIKLRSMTTNEEMLRLSPSERSFKVLADIIDACLLTKLPISSYDMCVGDFQFLLHKLRVTTYGPDYSLIATCPFCGNQMSVKLNLDELEFRKYSEDCNKFLEFDLPVSKNHIKIKAQTPRILDDVAIKSKDLKKQATAKTGDLTLLFNIMESLEEVDYEKPNPLYIENFIRDLPMRDSNIILKHIQKINESIGLNTDIDITCDLCGLAYKSPFRITQEFFGPSIDI